MSNPITRPNHPAFDTIDGLTKREYFAAVALQGLCSNPAGIHTESNGVTEAAVVVADALIVALNKESSK